MKILGISAFYHDAAAALLCDGKIIAAAQEERFSRKKHDASFPSAAIKDCLNQSGYELRDIDAIAFYDKPFLKFERLLETYYAFAPRGLPSFIKSMPVWIKEKLFLKKMIYEGLENIADFDRKRTKLLFPEHHLSHAASAFYPSGFEEAAVLTIDGVGEWATASICKGEGSKLTVLKEMHFPHSLGLLYSACTYYCGFRVNSGEYKLMGLAPYGNKSSAAYKKYFELIASRLVTIYDDGSIFLDQAFFNYATGTRMVNDDKWYELFGFQKREPETDIQQHHCDFALAIQTITEEVVIKMAAEAKRITGSKYLCMAGGVALNCVANGKLLNTGIFEKIFIQPAAGDAGGALGAALSAHHIYFGEPVPSDNSGDALQGSFLGAAYSDQAIIKAINKFSASYKTMDSFPETCEIAANLLNTGNVIGWFQGRMEFGPRALGARSIIADARNPEMQKRLNLKIKYRESFRPFAPAVLEEDVQEYFELNIPSPYMLLVEQVKKTRQLENPVNFEQLPLLDKLYIRRSDLPAITHVDGSARIQTVDKKTNYLFWQLLTSFKNATGCSVLINTSFNVRGEPMVQSPEDAYRCFMQTDMDYLVMGNMVFEKAKQPIMDSKYIRQQQSETD